MGKDAAWAGEAARGQGLGQRGHGLLFQGLHRDALHAAHIDEIHGEGLSAGGIEALGSVALAQAQELVSLANSGPGQGSVEEAFGKFGRRRTQFLGLALDAVRRPGGVG